MRLGLWLILLLIVACGPSAEERAAYEQKQKENQEAAANEVIKMATIEIWFTSGIKDTIKVAYKRELRLVGTDLVDYYGTWTFTIARNVDYFRVIKEE